MRNQYTDTYDEKSPFRAERFIGFFKKSSDDSKAFWNDVKKITVARGAPKNSEYPDWGTLSQQQKNAIQSRYVRSLAVMSGDLRKSLNVFGEVGILQSIFYNKKQIVLLISR